jgi:8-oxo-dGTP diphosphatase
MPASDQGTLTSSYSVVQRVLIFLTRKDQVLLIKGASNKQIWANRYNGIGGHVKPGENVLSAAYRELFEETGIDASKLQLCGIINIDTGSTVGITVVIFHGEYYGEEVIPSSEGKIEWVSFEMIPRIPSVEDIPVLLQHVLKYKSSGELFFGSYHYDQEGNLKIRFFGEEVWLN